MISRSLGHRAPLLWLLLPFMAGLAAGRLAGSPLPLPWLLGGALISVVAAACWRNTGGWIGLVVGVTLAGTAYHELRRARLQAWNDLPPREARLTVRIDTVFAPAPEAKSAGGLARITHAEAHLRELTDQRLYFSVRAAPDTLAPRRGAEVVILGVLEPLPERATHNTFDGYLTSAGFNFKLTRGHILEERSPPSAYARFLTAALARFGDILSRGLDARPELSGVLRAMLLGLKHELSDEQKTLFLQSGTMHLFAISGLHITVIALGLQTLLRLLRLPAWLQATAGTTALWLYVDITGGTPSAVRAFVMVAMIEAALLLRTPRNAIAALTLSALVMLLIEPMQLFGASFQMSYGIVAAILLYGLPLGERWQERLVFFRGLPPANWCRWQRAVDFLSRWLLSLVAIGVAVTLVSVPSGILFFGLFTPGAFFANLVLVPLSTLVILAGFLSLLVGLAGLGWLASVFNHAGALVIWAMDAGIAAFVRLPGVAQPAEFSAPWTGAALFALVLGLLLYGYARRWEQRGGYWAPLVIAALALVLGARFG
ncbi:MAG TPA: ComEC/Rec2 family competence protein [Opitutaceae bacterium]